MATENQVYDLDLAKRSLDKAILREAEQARVLATSRRELDAARQFGMPSVLKRVGNTVKRQEMALALTQAEIRELKDVIERQSELPLSGAPRGARK